MSSLHGLPISHIITKAKKVFQHHRQILTLLALALRVGGWAMMYAMTNYMQDLPLIFEGGNVIIDPAVLSSNDPVVLRQTLQPFLLTGSILLLLVVLALMIVQIFVMDMTFSTSKKIEKTYQDMLRTTFMKLTPYLGTSLLQSFFLVLLYLLFIIPGIIYSIYRLFTTAIVVFTEKSYRQAMRESKQIVRGRWWKTALYIVCITFFFSLVQSLVGWVLGYMAQGDIAEAIMSLFSKGIQLIVMVVVACFFLVWQETQLPLHDKKGEK